MQHLYDNPINRPASALDGTPHNHFSSSGSENHSVRRAIAALRLAEQVIQQNLIAHDSAVFVLLHAKGSDHRQLYRLAAVRRFPEDSDLIAQILVVILIDLKAVERKLHLAEIDHLVSPVDILALLFISSTQIILTDMKKQITTEPGIVPASRQRLPW
jgi:hypothetical protein